MSAHAILEVGKLSVEGPFYVEKFTLTGDDYHSFMNSLEGAAAIYYFRGPFGEGDQLFIKLDHQRDAIRLKLIQ